MITRTERLGSVKLTKIVVLFVYLYNPPIQNVIQVIIYPLLLPNLQRLLLHICNTLYPWLDSFRMTKILFYSLLPSHVFFNELKLLYSAQ